MSMVRYSEDAIAAPSTRRIETLKALSRQPDSEIDTSDLPPLGEDVWQQATRGRFYKPVKKATSVRIDMDVLAWLKNQGKGYQTKINTILRAAMLDAMRHKA